MSFTPSLPGVEEHAYPWKLQETVRARDGTKWLLHKNLVQTPEALAEMAERVREADWLIYDSETSGLNPHLGARICGHAIAIPIGPQEVVSWYVPVRHRATSEIQLTPEVVSPVIAGIVAFRAGKLLGHNVKFEELMLRADGIRIHRERHDTVIASIIANENEESFALKNLGGKYCYAGADSESKQMDVWMRNDAKLLKMKFRERGKKNPTEPSYLERFGYSRTPVRMCGSYACKDVFLTWLLWQKVRWATEKFAKVYQRDLGIAFYLHEMEWRGLDVNVATIREAQATIHQEVEYWQTQIRHLTGDPHFIVKDSALRTLFFDTLKMTPAKTTDAGLLSVDKESRMLLAKSYPANAKLIKAVDAFSTSQKIESTYAANFLKFVTSENKIHPNYNQLEQRDEGGVPVTGRMSSANPNIQNIAKKPYHLLACCCKKCSKEFGRPIGPELTVSVRRYFTVRPGWLRVFIDLSQIELRTLAWLSRDPVLLDCYANDLDVHKITADEVTGGDRDIAKQVNFGNSYGMTEVGLAKRLPYYADDPERALRDAGVYLKKFFETYAGILRFRAWLAAFMRANNYQFVSPFGRPRRIPTIASSDDSERARAERMMMSSIVSGTAADLMKDILLRSGALIYKEQLPVEIAMSIHDEIAYDMPIAGCAKIIPKLAHCFTDQPMFEKGGVPIRISIELSTSTWEDKRAIEIEADSFRWAA